MVGEIDNSSVVKAYARWAPVYDVVFGKVFERGRRASIAAAERIGGRILDVGIGTGISLMDFARSNCLVGVDYSEAMLRKAYERVREHRLGHVAALAVMDAQRLGFADGYFDVVVAQYVITAVPDPVAVARRICARGAAGRRDHPGQSPGRRGGFRRLFERGFAPIARRLGWRPEFPSSGSSSGPRSTAACAWSSAARCPRSGISP